MSYDPMGHVGLEADYFVTPQMLSDLGRTWHYGFKWNGTEKCAYCSIAACGLVERVDDRCDKHRRVAAAKQLHKASECPDG